MNKSQTEAIKLHDLAMSILDQALQFTRKGQVTKALQKRIQAFQSAKAAAYLLRNYPDFEPERSVIHRSAATLAFQINYFESAKTLIIYALLGNPPPEIAQELKNLLQQLTENNS